MGRSQKKKREHAKKKLQHARTNPESLKWWVCVFRTTRYTLGRGVGAAEALLVGAGVGKPAWAGSLQS